MANRAEIASITCSLSLAALLVWMAWPQGVPAQADRKPPQEQTEPAYAPADQQKAAAPAEPVLTAIALPPPPAASSTAPTEAPAVQPETVQPMRPLAKASPSHEAKANIHKKQLFKPIKPQELTSKTTLTKTVTPRKPTPDRQAVAPVQPPEPARQMAAIDRQEPPKPESRIAVLQPMAATGQKAADNTKTEDAPRHDQNNRQGIDRTVTVTASHDNAEAQTGRALLRLLEHGQGPGIEIAWPGYGAENNALYKRLQRCFGMVNAIVTSQGQLYSMQSPVGENWVPNIDRYSGFVRQPAGRTISAEQRNALQIRRRHGLGAGGKVVRIFPRNVDAAILGGLQSIIGNNYRAIRNIQASYQTVGGQLEVTNIIVDGTSYSETIAVAPVRRCGDAR